MVRSNNIHNSSTSSFDSASSRELDDDVADFASNNNETSTASMSSSPSALTSRPKIKAKRSLVWRYFKNCDDKDKSFNAQCILCPVVINRSSTSTSNLLHHIQSRHEPEFQLIDKSMKSKAAESSQRLPLSSERAHQLTKLAAELIIYNLLPLSIVESPQLQQIFQEAEPTYVLPKRKYFTGNFLNEMFQQTRQKVQNELQSAIGIFLTTDMWTSQANQAYITITAHFVDPTNSRLKSYVLETTGVRVRTATMTIVSTLLKGLIRWHIISSSIQ